MGGLVVSKRGERRGTCRPGLRRSSRAICRITSCIQASRRPSRRGEDGHFAIVACRCNSYAGMDAVRPDAFAPSVAVCDLRGRDRAASSRGTCWCCEPGAWRCHERQASRQRNEHSNRRSGALRKNASAGWEYWRRQVGPDVERVDVRCLAAAGQRGVRRALASSGGRPARPPDSRSRRPGRGSSCDQGCGCRTSSACWVRPTP